MAPKTQQNPPIKAILFDIGGVVVLSPMLAITAYETAHNIPSGYINHAIRCSFPDGAWSRLERNEIPLDHTFFAEFSRDLGVRGVWEGYYRKKAHAGAGEVDLPDVPKINGEQLFWEMMRVSREMDPYVSVAVGRLRGILEDGDGDGSTKRRRRYTLGALTNDYTFPPTHPYTTDRSFHNSIRALFDVYISSSAIGMRKPERRVYEYAINALSGAHRELHGTEDGLKAEEIVFLDDIGMNLKGAGEVGMRGVKVNVGETWKAVRELEGVLGLEEGSIYSSTQK
ncbi:HAD-like domain-containing protein [Peziza echinospora]|nr:HAD-like domain-containing protein [Peziza echinospora]